MFLKQKPNVQEETHSCARDQVVIAKPPVPALPQHYRRSLVSKGRFDVPTNVMCVGIRSGPPKRRYCVVMDCVGGTLGHRGRRGCRLFEVLLLAASCFVGHDTRANLEKQRVACGFSWCCCEWLITKQSCWIQNCSQLWFQGQWFC